MKVSVNIVTWNGEKYIESCIQSVLNQTFQDFSVLIIDNGSTDATVSLIKERFPQLKVVLSKDNTGFSKAHNKAIHWTSSDYVLCLNQDVVLKKDFLEKAVNFLDSKKDAGAIAGKLLKLHEEIGDDLIDSCGLQLKKNFLALDIFEGEKDEGQCNALKEVFGVSGAAPIYRREALASVKYKEEFFDEDFFSYKEDVDLAIRLRYLGWKAYYLPDSCAYHVRTVGRDANKKIRMARKFKSDFANFYSYRNQLLLLKKDLPKKKLKYIFPVFWYEFKKFVYVLFLEHKSWKAWGEYFKLKKTMKEKRLWIREKRVVTDAEVASWFKL